MSFISSFLEKLYGKPEFRCLMVGLDAAGRTTALYKLKLGEVVTTIPTIGFNVETIEYKGTKLTFWDVGGCDKIRPLWRHYFQNTQAVVFVIDSNDKERLNEVEWSLGLMLSEDELRDAFFLILANKMDLPGALKVSELVEKLNLNAHMRNKRWGIFPVSAILGDGLYESLDFLVQSLKEKKESSPPKSLIVESKPIETEKDDLLTSWLKREDEPDDEFLEKLSNYNLQTWDHRTHLRIAWLYLQKEGRKKGMELIFEKIKNFIANSKLTHRSNGTTFHETLTYFWVHMTDYAMKATKNPDGSFKGFLVTNPQLSNGGFYLEFYKKETMMNNPEARIKVVLPDIKPLPSLITNVDSLKKDISEVKISSGTKKELTDAEFYDLFTQKKLNQWGHDSYLRAIYHILKTSGRKEALKQIEVYTGSGFHLTLTYFWIQMIDLNIKKQPNAENFQKFYNNCPSLKNEKLPLDYFSQKVLYSDSAAKEMAIPDKKQLPSVV